MLKEFFRIFKDTGSSLVDISLNNQDDSLTVDINAGQTIYIAQKFPFNHLFFEINSASTVTSDVSIQYWDGSDFIDTVDVIDATSSGGITLSKSGVIMFQRDKNYHWNNVDDTSENNRIDELSDLVIYDMYWSRLIFSGATECKLSTIQYAFTTSESLSYYDVEIDQFFESFAVGKTNWNREIMTASKLLVMDLRKLGIIDNNGQINLFDDFSSACAYKTLYLIYSNLGKGYEPKKIQAMEEYNSLLSIKRFKIDEDKDGRTDRREYAGKVRTLTR